MEHKNHTVSLVLDKSFGEKLIDLAKESHVWAMESPLNKKAAEKIWQATEGYDTDTGITTFPQGGITSPEDILKRIFETIEEHHNWNTLEVYGSSLKSNIRNELEEEYNVIKFEINNDGFTCYRLSP